MQWTRANSMSFSKTSLTKMTKSMRTLVKTIKKHFKNVIHEKMSYIVFVRPKQKRKAKQLISSSKTFDIVSNMTDESSTEFEIKLM